MLFRKKRSGSKKKPPFNTLFLIATLVIVGLVISDQSDIFLPSKEGMLNFGGIEVVEPEKTVDLFELACAGKEKNIVVTQEQCQELGYPYKHDKQ